MGRLANKIVLITGAAQGLGEAFAREVVAQGGKVALGDILESKLDKLATELGSENAISFRLDVSNTESWESAINATKEKYGMLNVLINNAGIAHFSSLESYEDSEWEKVIKVNATGTFKGIRAAIPMMKKEGRGSIVNISSVAGLKGFDSLGAYVSSKFAVRGLTKTAALELAKYGIRVNSIHPGFIATDMANDLVEKLDHIAMARLGTSQEVCNLAVFLASDESSLSTGAEFVADGGETCGIPDLFSHLLDEKISSN